MTRYLPICLKLENRRVLVVGGGNVGEHTAREFLECGARVTVISPEARPWLQEQAAAGRIALHLRRWAPGDLEGCFLAVMATDDPAVNEAAFAEAEARGVLANVCDDPAHCRYIFASKIERGPLTVSIFSHGTAPALSRRVRRDLEAWLGPEYAALATLMATLRPRVKALPGLTQPDRQRIFERLVYGELLYLLREGRTAEAEALAERIIREETGKKEE